MVKKLDGQDILDGNDSLQAIMTAGRALHAAINTMDGVIAEQLGIPRNDLRCLHLLKDGPITAGDIAAGTGLTSGSVTALVDRLEAGGQVERQRSTADRRSVEIAMSEYGARNFQAIGTEIEQAIRDHFQYMTRGEIAAAGAALAGFAEALGKSAERLRAYSICPERR